MSDLDARLAQRDRRQEEEDPLPDTLFAISIISFSLGNAFVLAFWLPVQLGFFVAALAFFHWAEFAVTAGWNQPKVSVNSFLLNNGWMYHFAHALAISEYGLTRYLKPKWKQWPYISEIGMILVILSQILRSLAMIHAATNFAHEIQRHKDHKHVLVTHGVYSWMRHPSYTGFFYWGLGTQMVLQNPVSFLLYAMLLWRFFHSRIQYEEKLLTAFFPRDYPQYRLSVGTKLPFIL